MSTFFDESKTIRPSGPPWSRNVKFKFPVNLIEAWSLTRECQLDGLGNERVAQRPAGSSTLIPRFHESTNNESTNNDPLQTQPPILARHWHRPSSPMCLRTGSSRATACWLYPRPQSA